MKRNISTPLISILVSLLALLFVSIGVFPELLFLFPMGQKALLKWEGEQVAEFYFKDPKMPSDTLYMNGVIYSYTLNEIKDVLEKNPQVKTLTMVEVAGSVDDEINLLASREIRKRGINTYIPENGWVASGGTDMFLAGKERAIHPKAKLGVHSWAGLGGEIAAELPKDHVEHKKYLDYYKEMDIPLEFYWYTLVAAPASDIHWMTRQEIDQYEVVTSLVEIHDLSYLQQTLSSDEFMGRGTGNNQKAQDFIRAFFKQHQLLSFDKNYNAPFTFKDSTTGKVRKGNNLVAYVKGSEFPNKYLVVGAHYDHLGVQNDTIFNGADDNASGTAALMVLANHFTQVTPKHSIIFAAFDAEELGLFGSAHFVNHPPVSLESIAMNFNFDMISRNDKNELYVVGTRQYPTFKPLIEVVAKDTPLTILFGHDIPKQPAYWMNSSDNAAFFQADIPNFSFSEEDHLDYHRATDGFRNTQPAYFHQSLLFIHKVLKKIDQNFPQAIS